MYLYVNIREYANDTQVCLYVDIFEYDVILKRMSRVRLYVCVCVCLYVNKLEYAMCAEIHSMC